jgi:hypothetical protein
LFFKFPLLPFMFVYFPLNVALILLEFPVMFLDFSRVSFQTLWIVLEFSFMFLQRSFLPLIFLYFLNFLVKLLYFPFNHLNFIFVFSIFS